MFESVVNMGVLVTGKIKDGAKRFLGFQYVEAYKILNHLKQVEPEFASKVYDPKEVKMIIAGRKVFVSEYGNVGDW